MQDTLTALVAKAQADLSALKTRPEFEAAKARFVGPNGELTALMKQMGAVPKEQRPAMGKLVNETKTQIQALLDAGLARIEAAELQAQLGPAVDPTLPSPDPGPGTYHPLTLVREEMCRILRKVGFTVADGPEVETEYYCFDADLTATHLPKVKKPWIEIGGCGMVDPTVFEAVGYDPEVWSGYAFGMGLERLAMLLYGIDDIRHFYQNDLRFLKQFA